MRETGKTETDLDAELADDAAKEPALAHSPTVRALISDGAGSLAYEGKGT
jgi:hypothetical protein